MARRRLIWHIGPTDPGAEFLAGALDERRSELAAEGVQVPGPELTWPSIEKAVWAHKGTTVLSTPGIARAGREKVALRLAGLRDVELHVVLLVRDLPTQVYAAWQAGIQDGSTTGLEKYAARVLDASREHWQAEEFWSGRDLEQFLPLWTRAMLPERVHIVSATAEAELWDTFLAVAGVEHIPSPTSRLEPAFLAPMDEERVLDLTTRWAKLAADAGFDVRGHGLVRATREGGVVPTRGQQFDAIADLLAETTSENERLRLEVAELRRENQRLDRKRRKHKRRVAQLEEENRPSLG